MAKTTRKQALGRGLSALLKDPENDINEASDKNAGKVVGSIINLDLDVIEMNPFQPRTNFNETALKELAVSISELGVIQPITVRKIGFNRFQLVTGERRLRACKMAGEKSIPAYVRLANDQQSLEMALVENIQRQDLDPIEIALSYQRLLDEIALTQEQLSSRVGKKRSTIANYLRLLKLDPIVQTGMRDGFIGMGHGRALINIESREDQLAIYKKIIGNALSVRDTEKLVRRYQVSGTLEKVKIPSQKITPSRYLVKSKEELQEYLSAEIQLRLTEDEKGRIIISFNSEEEFDLIKKRILGA